MNFKENFTNDSKIPKVVYCCWTGTNPLTKNRKECLDLIKKNIGVKVILITPENIDEFIKPNYPLHKTYYYLSDFHKSDYLRTYLMHHYGGGYSDIKRIYTDWNIFFDNLNNSNNFANGSREHSGGCASYNNEYVRIIILYIKMVLIFLNLILILLRNGYIDYIKN
jgi:hypothetical protein